MRYTVAVGDFATHTAGVAAIAAGGDAVASALTSVAKPIAADAKTKRSFLLDLIFCKKGAARSKQSPTKNYAPAGFIISATDFANPCSTSSTLVVAPTTPPSAKSFETEYWPTCCPPESII